MGFLDLLAAGFLAKRTQNKLNPPFVTVPSGYEIVGMKPRGMNEYEIRYRKVGSNYKELMIIQRTTRSRSGGWEFHWD